MQKKIPENLVVLELANNHMGDLLHGIEVIRQFGTVCRGYQEFNFAFKLQYRDLDTLIHPSKRGRTDIKYIKRFEETRLKPDELKILLNEMRENDFTTMVTPFDEPSVDLIERHGVDLIKVASCSFNDWPLLERIAETDNAIIASTAGADLGTIDSVVSFFMHRDKEFAILHCVGEYPTPEHRMHVGQIEFLCHRYPKVRIGLSSHENPENCTIVQLAVAKNATILEKHVGVGTEKYPLNAYSVNPEQFRLWIEAARNAQIICGVSATRLPSNLDEKASLFSLRRGVFARRALNQGEPIKQEDIYYAFPPEDGQITANDCSKYTSFTAISCIEKDSPLTRQNTLCRNVRILLTKAVAKVKRLLDESRISVPGGVDLELSHHYGLERFGEFGLTMITVVNRGYCKKLLICLPGQEHPEQYHKEKEETFHVLYGEIEISLNGLAETFRTGDVINIEPGVRHKFISLHGAVIEEISSTHFKHDSYYTDEAINNNPNRKTYLTYWMS